MLWAARGRVWDSVANDWATELVPDGTGGRVRRRVLRPPETRAARRVIGRMILVGLNTGTRNAAMREMSWYASEDGGCIDVESRHVHRRGFGRDPSVGKPRASPRISRKLASMARRWRDADLAAGFQHVLHQLDGNPYLSSPKWLWNAVTADAGLGDDVVPHTLRHTAATWLRIPRVDVRAAADLLGMSVQTAVRIYGQWTLEGQDSAADALGSAIAVKANAFLAKPTPAEVPMLPPAIAVAPEPDRRRESPGVAQRRKRHAARANGGPSLRSRVGYAPAVSRVAKERV